jgi:tRNA U34 5-methylaminomethyl-2-thiouridine-forming methyltransferase MnmC
LPGGSETKNAVSAAIAANAILNAQALRIGLVNVSHKFIRRRYPCNSDALFDVVETDDGSRTLYSHRAGESYHSEAGALSESDQVFLTNSGVKSRLQQNQTTRVFELGFGTGLNFLLSADWALSCGAALQYVAFENQKLNAELIAELGYADLLVNKMLGANWLNWYRDANQGESGKFEYNDGSVALNLFNSGFTENFVMEINQFDAIYFDAFSPKTNPELWTQDVFGLLHRMLLPGGRLVSYCVKSTVLRDLETQGFEVYKLAGPKSGKREVLCAVCPGKK